MEGDERVMWWWGALAVLMFVVGVGLIVWWALVPRTPRLADSETGFLSDEQVREIDQQYRA